MPEARTLIVEGTIATKKVVSGVQECCYCKQVSEEKLIQLLGQLNEQTAPQSRVTVQRRRPVWDDDDDDL